MFKLIRVVLLCSAASLVPSPARADPITALVTQIGSWLTATFGATLGGIIGNLGVSILLSAVSRALAGKPKQQQLIRELTQPTSLPVYRYVYGYTRAPGTPAPVLVKGSVLYTCHILNSRPSAGPFTLLLDKREVEKTGDEYDFSGSGATATNEPFAGHLNYWIGRGDQTGIPAQILAEAPEYYLATDMWRGRTVIWMRVHAGANESRSTRWPATPPEVMVDGYWSLVRDPRDPDAPAAWSANYALCLLDALRENPLRPYDDRNLWLETFAWAADVAGAGFPVKAGGTAPFECNGVLAFSDGVEVEDQVLPIAACGAAGLNRIAGVLGVVPAIYQAPVMTLRDVLGDEPMVFSLWRPSGELATEVTATYTNPDRAYEDAETPAYVLPGAQDEDGKRSPVKYDLGMITDHRQAQWVAAISGRRTRMQRSLSAVFAPEAFDLVPGAVAEVDLPAPYTRRNGIYKVEQASPGGDPVGQSGFAMRIPMRLRVEAPEIYQWSPETDEKDIIAPTFDPYVSTVQPTGAISLTSDASTTLISGDSSVARVRFSFEPSASASAIAYEWQYRVNAGDWQSGGTIDATIVDGFGDVFGFVVPAVIGSDYEVRARTLTSGAASTWVVSDPITASAGSYLAPPPTPLAADGGVFRIDVLFQAPNSPDYRALDFWGSDTDDSGAAVLLNGPVYGAPNDTTLFAETGLAANQTRYYFSRSRDRNGEYSPFSVSISGTTDP